MQSVLSRIKGDRAIWAIVGLLALISFLPVYSASAHPVFHKGNGTTLGYLLEHGGILISGIVIMYIVHNIPTFYFKALTYIGLYTVIGLLLYTLLFSQMEGVDAKRWISFFGLSFQTSTLASIVLTMWVARYLNKTRNRQVSLAESFVPLWLPVLIVLGLIYSQNLSTALMLGGIVYLLCFVGGHPTKNLLIIGLTGLAGATIFISLLFRAPEVLPDRAMTWRNRIEAFWEPEKADPGALHQSSMAKLAANEGGLVGKGFGKSTVKNELSQGDSDFIFAIVAGEYGIWGSAGLIALYLLLLVRFVVVAQASRAFYSKMLVICVGFPIISQALLNIGVVVGLLPVTGQPLPLISSGGTSIWITCAALGVILSASNKDFQNQLIELEKQRQTPEAQWA